MHLKKDMAFLIKLIFQIALNSSCHHRKGNCSAYLRPRWSM